MPSSTFLNLPAQKQERLLEAATREFSSRPFSEASINQIIKDAGIPRGSFYMYFTDKEELFRYVISGYVNQLLMVIRECVLRAGGDLFQAMLDLFDYVCKQSERKELGGMGAMAGIIGCNSGMQKNTLLGLLDRETILQALRDTVDPESLDLQREEDLRDILAVVLSVTGPLLYSGIQSTEREASRAHLENILNICKRGMGREKGPAFKHLEEGKEEQIHE